MSLEAELAETRALLAQVAAELRRVTTPVPRAAYRVTEAAAALGVEPAVVRRMIREGGLPYVVLPTMGEKRIPVAAIDALVAGDRWERTEGLAVVS